MAHSCCWQPIHIQFNVTAWWWWDKWLHNLATLSCRIEWKSMLFMHEKLIASKVLLLGSNFHSLSMSSSSNLSDPKLRRADRSVMEWSKTTTPRKGREREKKAKIWQSKQDRWINFKSSLNDIISELKYPSICIIQTNFESKESSCCHFRLRRRLTE